MFCAWECIPEAVHQATTIALFGEHTTASEAHGFGHVLGVGHSEAPLFTSCHPKGLASIFLFHPNRAGHGP